MRPRSILLALTMSVAACTGSSAPPSDGPSSAPSAPPSSAPSAPPSSAASEAPGLILVGLGDSWPAGEHCGGCATFADQYATGLEAALGTPVAYIDQNGDPSTDTATLLANLRSPGFLQDSVRRADVVLIATGPNDIVAIEGPIRDGSCGGPDGFDCIRSMGDTWATAFDAIVTEIRTLRDGQPTAIRLVTAANAFLFDEGIREAFGVDEDFALTGGALIYQSLADAMCGAADAHDASCIDVRPIVSGPDMDQPGDENAPEHHTGIADALIASGLPELEE